LISRGFALFNDYISIALGIIDLTNSMNMKGGEHLNPWILKNKMKG